MAKPSRFSAKAVQRLLLHLLCLVPAAWLFYLAATDGLGANPAEALLRSLGDWAIRFICFALAVTPLRQWLRWNGLAAYRRMLGLYAFFYASLHWLAYVVFDMGVDWPAIVDDLIKRPFILVGTLAWLILLGAGHYFGAQDHPAHGRQTLADAAPRGVWRSRAGRAALLVDAFGQEQLCRGVALRAHPGRAAGGALGFSKAQADASGGQGCQSLTGLAISSASASGVCGRGAWVCTQVPMPADRLMYRTMTA